MDQRKFERPLSDLGIVPADGASDHRRCWIS
jgi:hypothetical protein